MVWTKEQQKEYAKKWRMRNLDREKQLNKEYYEQNSVRVRARIRKWKKDNPKLVSRCTKRWASKNAEKTKAHYLLNRAVKTGAIKKPERCFDCGEIACLDGHHEDYGKPLVVVWLCRVCHVRRHQEDGKTK